MRIHAPIPNRGSLLKAVENGLGLEVDKSAFTLKLKNLDKAEFHRRGFGNPRIVTFKSGATKHCYGAEVVLCPEDDDDGVGVHNYAVTRDLLEQWADELWRKFVAEFNDDE